MTAPTEPQTLAALAHLQGLAPEAFRKAVDDDVGPAVLSTLRALVEAFHPDDDDDARARRLQLMIFSFMLAQRLGAGHAR